MNLSMTLEAHEMPMGAANRPTLRECQLGSSACTAYAIIHAGADYLLDLKGNQGSLHDDVRAFFTDPENLEYARQKGGTVETVEHHDNGHGRIEKRVCTVTDWLDWMPAKARRSWLGHKTIVRIECHTTLPGGKVREDTRYYDDSRPLPTFIEQPPARL